MNYDMHIEQLQPTSAAVVVEVTPIAGISSFVGEAFGLVMAELQRQHASPCGPPFARYRMMGDRFEVSAGFPVVRSIATAGRVVPIELPGGRAVVTMHVGQYSEVKAAYDAIMAWLPGQQLEPAADPWEFYLDGPEVAEPRTRVVLPVRSTKSDGTPA